jgi:hypothetical protein
VREAKGKILSEDAGFVVVNGIEPLMETFQMTQLAEKGLWDQSPLIKDLQDRSISLVILQQNLNNERIYVRENFRRFTPEIIRELRANYHLVDKIGRFHIYKPLDAPGEDVRYRGQTSQKHHGK